MIVYFLVMYSKRCSCSGPISDFIASTFQSEVRFTLTNELTSLNKALFTITCIYRVQAIVQPKHNLLYK